MASGGPPPSPVGFKTSQGSTYTLDGESTQRTKILHKGHDPKDVGLKEPSERTVYVDNQAARRTGMFGTQSGKKTLAVLPDGTIGLLGWNAKENKWGISPGDRFPFSTTPEVGKAPLELWKGRDDEGGFRTFGKWHPGNAITEIQKAAADDVTTKSVVGPSKSAPDPAPTLMVDKAQEGDAEPATAKIEAAESAIDPDPSDAQKESGNYAKGPLRLHGLDIRLENAKGSERTGTDKNGKPWSTTLPAAYGYVRGTEGKDGDQQDVYVASEDPTAFVIDQVDPETGEFDEHKTVLGAKDEAEARSIYEGAFSDGTGPQRLGAITPLPIDAFKAWLNAGNTKKPLAYKAPETPHETPHEINIVQSEAPTAAEVPQGVTTPRKNSENNFSKEDADKAKAKLREKLGSAPKPDADPTEPFMEAARKFVRESAKPLTPRNLMLELGTKDAKLAKKVLTKLTLAGDIRQAKDLSYRRKPVQRTPQGITQYVASIGGISLKDKGEITDPPRMVPGYGPLFRKNGRPLDDLAQSAHDAGYLKERDPDELVRLIEEEMRGRKQVAVTDLSEQMEREQAVRTEGEEASANAQLEVARAEVGDAAEAADMTLTEGELDRAATEMILSWSRRGAEDTAGPGMTPEQAVEWVAVTGAADFVDDTPQLGETIDYEDDIPFDVEASYAAQPDQSPPAGSEAGADGAAPEGGRGPAGDRPAPRQEPSDAGQQADDLEGRARGWIAQLRKKGASAGEMLDLVDDAIQEQIANGMAPAYARQIGATARKLLKAETAAKPPKAEKGAEGFDQLIIPGAEPSVQQAMDARKGKGKGSKKRQLEADEGIFAAPPDDRQQDLEAAAAPTAPPAKPSNYGKNNLLFTEDAAAKARALLKAKLNGSQLNAGFDPEIAMAGLTLAGYHIEAGAREFSAYARAMLEDLGDAARPFLRYWYDSVRTYPGFNAAGMSSGEEIDRVLSGGLNLEPDRGDAAATDGLGEADVPAATGGAGTGAGAGGAATEAAGSAGDRDRGLPDSDAALLGADSDQLIPAEDPGWNPSLADRGQPDGSGEPGEPGLPAEPAAAEAVKELARAPARVEDRAKAQAEADKIPVQVGDEANIRATLPLLLPEQQDDVIKAETRYAKTDKGFGFLLTNGTGTGKTYSGLGVIKRFARRGKTNVLIVAPSQGILDGWILAGADMGLTITRLEDTGSPGKGIVATTYANFRDNRSLGDRDWDLIVPDESHNLMQAQGGEMTASLKALRGLTLHPQGLGTRADMILRDESDKVDNRARLVEARMATRAQADELGPMRLAYDAKRKAKMEELKAKPRANVLFLSATPFAYVEATDYAEGYLFEHEDKQPKGYNSPDGRQAFFMQNFGYRMRTGKLNKPDAGVNDDVMQRAFHEKLKREGALSGRALTVDKDYDRKFVLVDDAVGNRIDQALGWLSDWDWKGSPAVKDALSGGTLEGKPKNPLYEAFYKQFDYLARMRLLEAIKAKHAVPIIQAHLDLGRKIVVFHDYNEGGGFDPFRPPQVAKLQISDGRNSVEVKPGALYAEFVKANPYVTSMDFSTFRSPLVELMEAFPKALPYNGKISKGKRAEAKRLFNADGSGHDLIIVQSAAGEAGISLHDTTGKHQRVTLNLGMPVRPVTAIQEEGRIYRVGQASDAIQRYMNTGTNWERWTFAGKIAERASTAENLAMGDEARTLKQSFVDAFQNADDYPPALGEGVGGKELDRSQAASLTPFERAKSYYYAQQKLRSKRDQREGVDYFPTPEPLGFKMVEWADIKTGDEVLEPSAGHGAIARFFPELAGRTLVEPSQELASRAALASPGANVLNERFEDLYIGRKYDAIVMNPPFGVGGKTAIEHLEKATRHLRNGGRVVALIPDGGKAGERFDKWYEDVKGVYLVADLKMPRVLFEKAGTAVVSRIVVLERQDDAEQADQIQESRREYSADTISQLFDRLEDASVKPRIVPKVKDANASMAATNVTAGGVEFQTRAYQDRFEARPLTRIGGARFGDLASAAERNGGFYDRLMRTFSFKSAEARNGFLNAVSDSEASAAATSTGSEPTPIGTSPAGRPGIQFKLGETRHAKTGEALWVASMNERVAGNVYTDLSQIAKRHGGWFSSYAAKGAIPGFQFKSEAQRVSFLAEAGPGDAKLQALAPTRLKMGIDRLVTAAETMSSWRDWYDRHKSVVARIFGDDAGLFQELLSATSQATGVKGNVTLALKAYDQLKRGEPFTGFLPSVIPNLERVRAQQELQGRKISAYGQANTGDSEAVAVDRHIGMLMFGTRSPTPRQITKAQATIRAVADRLGWRPREVQAALWAFNQVRMGTSPAEVQSYDTILEARADEIAALRSAFADAGGEGTGLPQRGDVGARTQEGRLQASARRKGHPPTVAEAADVAASAIVGDRGDPLIRGWLRDTEAEFRPLLRRIAGDRVDLRVVDEISAMGTDGERFGVGGMYSRSLITLALFDGKWARSLDDLGATLRHEAIHYLREVGAIPANAWKALEARAPEWRRVFGIDQSPAYDALAEAARNEEAIAEAYARWKTGELKVGPEPRAGFRFISRFLDGLRGVLSRVLDLPKIPTAADVFAAIERGDYRTEGVTATDTENEAEVRFQTTGLGPGSMLHNLNLPSLVQALNSGNTSLLAGAVGPQARGRTPALFDDLRRKFQDRFLFVRRAQEEGERAIGRPLTEAERPYLAEELYYGRVGEQKFRTDKDFKEPIVEAMNDAGLSVEEVDEWLTARHAEERNEAVAQINTRMPDGGSGMMTAEANRILAGHNTVRNRSFTPEQMTALPRIGSLVDQMMERRLDTMVQTGIIPAGEAQAYRSKYRSYVPLRGKPADPSGAVEEAIRPIQGRGFMGSRKREKRALGRKSRAEHVLATAFTLADEAIVRSEKNLVAQSLLNLAMAAPDPAVWEVNPVEREAYLARMPNGQQQVRYRYRPHYSGSDTVSVRVAGREFRVHLKDPDVLRAFDRLGGNDLDPMLRQAGKVSGLLSRLNTIWSPVFIVTNALVDFQTGLINLGREDLPGLRREVAGNWLKAARGANHYLKTGDTSTPWSLHAQEFRAAGGATAFNQIADVETREAEIQEAIRELAAGRNRRRIRKALHGYQNLIEPLNVAGDNAVRLSTFVALRRRGYTVAQAASAAKNLTVNFNRKGEYGPALNALFMFYNASIQGTATVASALLRSKKVRRWAMGAIALGAIQELANGMWDPPDDDDDELGLSAYDAVPEWQKQTRMVWQYGPDRGQYLMVPLPFVYGFLHNLGRLPMAYLRGAKETNGKTVGLGQTAARLLASFAHNMVPPGLGDMLVPTVAQPFVDVWKNEDYFGKPIMPTQFPGDEKPDSQRYFPSVPIPAKVAAQTLNAITGGDEFEAGWADVSPETLAHITATYAGAAGALALNTAKDLGAAGYEAAGWNAEDPNLSVADIPLVSKFVGTASPWQVKDITYQRIAEIQLAEDRAKGTDDRARRARAGTRKLLALKDEAGKLRKELGTLRKDRRRIVADERLSPQERRRRTERLDEREKTSMAAFNRRYIRAVTPAP